MLIHVEPINTFKGMKVRVFKTQMKAFEFMKACRLLGIHYQYIVRFRGYINGVEQKEYAIHFRGDWVKTVFLSLILRL